MLNRRRYMACPLDRYRLYIAPADRLSAVRGHRGIRSCGQSPFNLDEATSDVDPVHSVHTAQLLCHRRAPTAMGSVMLLHTCMSGHGSDAFRCCNAVNE